MTDRQSIPSSSRAQLQRMCSRSWSTSSRIRRRRAGEGDYFKAHWLKLCEKLPARKHFRIYGGSDYAVTAHGGDYTEHIVVGLDAEGRMYLLDLWRKRASSYEGVEAFCDLVRDWKPIGRAEEQGQIKSGVGQLLRPHVRSGKTARGRKAAARPLDAARDDEKNWKLM